MTTFSMVTSKIELKGKTEQLFLSNSPVFIFSVLTRNIILEKGFSDDEVNRLHFGGTAIKQMNFQQ